MVRFPRMGPRGPAPGVETPRTDGVKRKGKMFFFEKKNQKTFVCWVPRQGAPQHAW